MDNPAPTPTSNAERRREERKIWRTALIVSLLVHLAVLAFWRTQIPMVSPFAAAGPRAGDDRAAAGSMQAMNISVPPSVPIVPPAVPIPTIADIDPIDLDEDLTIQPEAISGSSIGTIGPGLETGEGLGDGGTSDSGRFRLMPPEPRGMTIPRPSDELKGRSVQIWVFVDAEGRVVPDSTRLRPPTSDGDFNKRLIAEAAEWIFKPAQQDGQPVASWFDWLISM